MGGNLVYARRISIISTEWARLKVKQLMNCSPPFFFINFTRTNPYPHNRAIGFTPQQVQEPSPPLSSHNVHKGSGLPSRGIENQLRGADSEDNTHCPSTAEQFFLT
jgi:hypothetical protein